MNAAVDSLQAMASSMASVIVPGEIVMVDSPVELTESAGHKTAINTIRRAS